MRIRMAENFRAVFYTPFYAAQKLRFYAAEGVDVELMDSSGPGGGPSALADGAADLTWGGPMRIMKARDQEPASTLMCFCEVIGRDPFFLVGRRDLDEFKLTDLPRLRFAAVSEVPTPWLCLQHDLRELGIDPASVNRAPARTMGENLAALAKGDVDVVQMFEPFASLALKQGAGRILYAASTRGPTVYTTFIATREGIARHRDAFAAITRGMMRMQAWLGEHGADELADAVAPFYPDVPRDVLQSSLARYREAGLWSSTPEVSRQGFARLAESLKSGGFISRIPSYEECIEQFARASE